MEQGEPGTKQATRLSMWGEGPNQALGVCKEVVTGYCSAPGGQTAEGRAWDLSCRSSARLPPPRTATPTHLCSLRNSMKILLRLYFILPWMHRIFTLLSSASRAFP